jgi:hypothetical protein
MTATSNALTIRATQRHTVTEMGEVVFMDVPLAGAESTRQAAADSGFADDERSVDRVRLEFLPLP